MLLPLSRPCLFLLISMLVCATETLVAQSSISKSDSLIAAGFRYLEAYQQLRNLGDARDAHRAFTEVLKKSPNNAKAHLGLGLAFTAVEKQSLDPLGLNDATGPVNHTMAIRHLSAALAGSDEDVSAAARAFVTVARREYDVQRMQTAITALEAVESSNDPARSAIAELYISMYDNARAEEAVKDARTVLGRRQLAIARVLQPAKMEQGGKEYIAALDASDSVELREFVRDARWLADTQEASTWTKLRADELRARLHQFWYRRALRAGVNVAQRLNTHFTRVQHAMQEFSFYRQRIGTRAGGTIDVQMDGLEYDVDDRAFTYVRYGEPNERIVTQDGGTPAGQGSSACRPSRQRGLPPVCQQDRSRGSVSYPNNQTWVYYNINDKPVAFDFFLLPMDSHGWTLVSDVVRCVGGSIPYSEQYLRDRMHIDPRYGQLLTECTENQARAPDPVRVQAIALPFARERRDSLQLAVVRDHGVPRTKKNVQLLADLVQFSGTSSITDVTAVITWPLNALQQQNGITRVSFSVTVADTTTGEVVTRDTTLNVRVPENAPAAVGRVYVRLETKPSPNNVFHIRARDLNDPEVITIIGEPVAIRSFAGQQLSVSDIAIVSGEGGSWTRGGRKLSLLPRGAVLKNFGAYYEAYGVAPGQKYQTTITFEPLDEGLAAIVKKLKGKQVVSFTFDGENESTEHVVRELRALQSELPPGNYRMSIVIKAGGQSAQSSRRITFPK